MKRFLALTTAVVLAMSLSMTAFASSSPSSKGSSNHDSGSSHRHKNNTSSPSTTSTSNNSAQTAERLANEAIAKTYGVAQASVGSDGSVKPANIATVTCPEETKANLFGAAATFKVTPVDSFVFSAIGTDPAEQITTAMSAANLPANCVFMVFDCFGNLSLVTPIINENGTATITVPSTCVITVCTQ